MEPVQHRLPEKGGASSIKVAFHDTDTDILAVILADSPDTPTSSQG